MSKHDLLDWDRTLVWHAFTQMAEYEPLVIESAEGCVLVDIDGREYIDGVSSLWCNIHGHRHPTIDAAVRAQLDRVAHVTNLGASNPTTIRLAKRLVDITPPGLNHVFFSDDGATAVEVAVKMAFQYWRQRDGKGVSQLPSPPGRGAGGEGGSTDGPHPNPLPKGEGTAASLPSPPGRGAGGEGGIDRRPSP